MEMEKLKFLVSKEITAHEFLFIIRKKLKLSKEMALFIFVNNKYSLKGGNFYQRV